MAPSPAKPSVTQYPTAEQEKAELKRYEEAKRAVDRMQSTIDDPPPPAPVAYESLFPATTRSAPTASSSHPPPPPADAPPPFEPAAGGSNIMAHLSEKERLRRQYEAQDAAAFARQNAKAAPPPIAYSPPALAPAPVPAAAGPLPGQYANALEEKEALRKKFEERDKATKANPTSQPRPQPPPRSNSVSSRPPASPKTNGSSSPGRSPSSAGAGSRPTPVPPASGSSRVLTAVEEKALLRAKYEARDGGNTRKSPPPPTIPNGSTSVTNGITTTPVISPSTPPPLMPRPPVEYIKETQEEDARLSRLNGQMPILDGGPLPRSNSISSSSPPSGVALDIKPFTPFRAGFDASLPGPPPPLPHQ